MSIIEKIKKEKPEEDKKVRILWRAFLVRGTFDNIVAFCNANDLHISHSRHQPNGIDRSDDANLIQTIRVEGLNNKVTF